MQVKWDGCLSQSFNVSNGVRKGSVLSPYLFAVYIADLSVSLNKVPSGCFVGNKCLNHIAFVDDICCFAPSLCGLQDLLNVCNNFAIEHDMIFNDSKSSGMIFQPKQFQFLALPKAYIGSNSIKFVSKVKYLGVCLNDMLTDDDDLLRQTRSLYAIGNILKSCFSNCSAKVKSTLFQSYCVSFNLPLDPSARTRFSDWPHQP